LLVSCGLSLSQNEPKIIPNSRQNMPILGTLRILKLVSKSICKAVQSLCFNMYVQRKLDSITNIQSNTFVMVAVVDTYRFIYIRRDAMKADFDDNSLRVQ
jgi:hypothetical protein